MCTKRLKGEPDQILLGKYYLELGKIQNIIEKGGEFICIYARFICF